MAHTTKDYLKFVTYEDGLIRAMADKLMEVYFDPEDAANCILAFVQTGFPYMPEDREYWRYPVKRWWTMGTVRIKQFFLQRL